MPFLPPTQQRQSTETMQHMQDKNQQAEIVMVMTDLINATAKTDPSPDGTNVHPSNTWFLGST